MASCAGGASQPAVGGAPQPAVFAQLEDLRRKFQQESADRMLAEAEEPADPMLAFADEARNRIEQELLILVACWTCCLLTACLLTTGCLLNVVACRNGCLLTGCPLTLGCLLNVVAC